MHDHVGSSAAPITPCRLSLVVKVEFHVAFEVSIDIGNIDFGNWSKGRITEQSRIAHLMDMIHLLFDSLFQCCYLLVASHPSYSLLVYVTRA